MKNVNEHSSFEGFVLNDKVLDKMIKSLDYFKSVLIGFADSKDAEITIKITTTNNENKTSSGDLSKESGHESPELLKYENLSELDQKNYNIINDEIDLVRECFVYEKDCDRLIDIILKYATCKKYDKGSVIKIRRNKKTKVVGAFKEIHRQLYIVDVLRKDVDYLNIIKILEPFKDLSDLEVYNAILK